MKHLPLLLALTVIWPVIAQTEVRRAQVFRCGPEGRDLRDSPCPSNSAAAGTGASDVSYDQPSGADTKAARERHIAEARQASALAQARRASEAEARHQRAAAVGLQTLPPPAQPASSPAATPLKPPKTAKPHRPHRPDAPLAGASSAAR